MKSRSTIIGMVFGICVAAWQPTLAWDFVPTGTTIPLRSLQFVGTDTGYAFGDSGIYLKTTDGGTDWAKFSFSSFGTAPPTRRPAHFISGQAGWVVAGSDSLYKTTDGGESWSFQFKALKEIRSVYFLNADTGIMVTCGANDTLRILRTTDGGVSWSTTGRFNARLQYPRAIHFSIHLSSSGKGWVIAGFANLVSPTGGIQTEPFGYLLKTQDAGETWTGDVSTTAWTGAAFPENDSVWLVSSYLGSGAGCGHYWCPGGSFNVLQVFRGKHAETNLVEQPNVDSIDNILNAIHFFGSDTGYMVGNAGMVRRTIDGGTTWGTQTAAAGKALHDVYIVSPTQAFAVGDSGTLITVDPSVPVSIQPSRPSAAGTQGAYLSGTVFHYNLPYVAEVSISLHDVQGKSLWGRKTITAPGSHALDLPLQRLPAGYYTLNFRAGGSRAAFPVNHRP